MSLKQSENDHNRFGISLIVTSLSDIAFGIVSGNVTEMDQKYQPSRSKFNLLCLHFSNGAKDSTQMTLMRRIDTDKSHKNL
jgi:hypothetical protein